MRSLFLAASENRWLKEQAPKHVFIRRAVSRFMPGETLEAALETARGLSRASISAVFTYLGENVTDREEAERVAAHYHEVWAAVDELQPRAEISVKLTQLGLDFDDELCYEHLEGLIKSAPPGAAVWIDMESTRYVDRTLALYRRAKSRFPNVGVCLQAYLYRTASDLESLLPLAPAIRLVKGAYNEPPSVAFAKKTEVDQNYYGLATRLISDDSRRAGVRAAIATHDRGLIQRIIAHAQSENLRQDGFEFQMLYGIQRAEQMRLARDGWKTRVLITYGSSWFPWYMRRLAERPANAWFVLRSLISD